MLGDKIRQKRKKLFLSEYELARRSGHSVSTIYGIENGNNKNPGFNIVCDLARVLGIPLEELDESEGQQVNIEKAAPLRAARERRESNEKVI